MPDNEFLPRDIKGRIACVLIGVTFGGIGAIVLAAFILDRRNPLDWLLVYEGALLATLFGATLLLWAIFRPEALQRFSVGLAGHMMLFVLLLFVPFAVQAILTLMR